MILNKMAQKLPDNLWGQMERITYFHQKKVCSK